VLWIYGSFVGAPAGLPEEIPGGEIFCGVDAYRFLLEVTTGLQSEVKGEADVFGQFKEAWAQAQARLDQSTSSVSVLSPWILKIFEDTKEIRSLYLQHTAGSSYGSLVRRLLKSYRSEESRPTLILGAGQIAKSIAPWLVESQEDSELWIWNRTQAAIDVILEEIKVKSPAARARIIGSDSELRDALRKAGQLVLCIPPEVAEDFERVRLWSEGNADQDRERPVIHLGGLKTQCVNWSAVANFHALDDLFALQKAREDARDERIERAFEACTERARLRALPGSTGSTSLPHGWKDLAVFESRT
jgi:hypothetical protein